MSNFVPHYMFIGDLHFRMDKYWDDVYQRVFNNLEKIIEEHKPKVCVQLGDFFDSARPYAHEWEQSFRYVKNIRNLVKDFYILGGNHTFEIRSHYDAIKVMESVGAEIITMPTQINNILYMPWIESSQRDHYCTAIKFLTSNVQAICYHFADETQGFAKPVFDFTDAFFTLRKELGDIKLIGGDIHKKTERYVGSVVPVSFNDEGQQVKRILLYNEDFTQKLSVPLEPVIEFVDIKMGDEPVVKEGMHQFFRITHVESLEDAAHAYKNIKDKIQKFVPVKTQEYDNQTFDDSKQHSIEEYLKQYCDDNQVNENISSILFSVLEK